MTTNSVSSQSSPRSQISIATQSSTMSSSVSQSVLPNQNKTVDSVSQDPNSSINKVNTSMDQVVQISNPVNPVLQPSQGGVLLPPSSSQVSTTAQVPKPTTSAASQANPPQPLSGTAPILINMVCNGQPTSILVDPTTMQVLGTVQTQQPPSAATIPVSQGSQQTPPSSAKGKQKKKVPVLCPKPTLNGPVTEESSVDIQPLEPVKKAPSKAKSKPKQKADQDATDILAKAAQSIFSSEISPGNFYNPANEDNPLQIDTSATEADDESKRSPKKGTETAKNKVPDIQQDEVTKLIEDQIKQVDDQNKAEKEKSEKMSSDGDIVTNLLNQETNVIENQQKSEPVVNEPVAKKGRKCKKSELNQDSSKETESTPKAKNRKTAGGKKGKQEEIAEPKDLPEEITFSENDISSVLDQVEGLGSPTARKTKSKKTKSDTIDISEPVSKKRKHTPTKSKSANESEKDTCSKPAITKSVYDFEEEEEQMVEDFSTPLFGFHPLRGSTSNTSTTKTNCASKNSESKKESKNKKSSEKKKQKEVKIDDSLLSPASDDLQINLDVDKSKEDPLNEFSSPEKTLDSVKMNTEKSQTGSKNDKTNNSFLLEKRMDYPNLEVTSNFTAGSEELISSNQKSDSEILTQSDIIPLDISTGNTSNDSADIDTMNSILGFSTNSLSPHIVSPKPRSQNNTIVTTSNSVISPVSMTTTVSMVTTTSSVTSSSSSQDLASLISASEKQTSSQNRTNSVSPKNTLDSLSVQNKPSDKPHDVSVTEKQNTDMSKKSSDSSKTKSIYSADNFVQSSRNDLVTPSTSKYEKTGTIQSKTTASSMPVSYGSMSNSRSNRSEYNDRPNTIKYTASHSSYHEASPDGFNFASMGSIGLNLSSSAQSGSFMDSLNVSPIMSTCSSTTVTTTAFTFTLSSVKTSVTSSNAPSAHQPQTSHTPSSSYPVYPQTSHHHSPGSSKPYHNINLPNFDMDLTRSMNSQVNRNSVQSQQRSNHDRIPPVQNQNNVPFPYGGSESCSMREQTQREPPRERTPVFQNITASTPPLGNKSQSDQIRNTQKQIQDLSQNHSVPPKSHDMNRNMNTVERSVSNNMQPFFPPNPLNTPPLHHPPLMSENNRQGMGGRSSYEPPFQAGQSQGYNSTSSQNYNRYESNSMPYSSHNSSGGTQPLSHTPPSNDGRKSANALSSNSKPNSNQSTRAMSGPSPGGGPTPPVSNRHTPPQAVQPPSSLSKSQRPQTASSGGGGSSGNSKKSKPSQKRTKQPSYEMESMPYPYFDPNRMTPFLGLPPQALSPPSRNVQTDGHLFSGNFLSHSSRPLSNSASSMNKNSELGGPFNSILPPSRGQNGLGLNFQAGFGMNSMHPSMSNAPSLTPHSGGVTVTPHMSNFSFPNIFPDTSQSDSPINFSPIKFHENHRIMESNSLQHHQGSSLFHPHNRSHPPLPNAMSINSILGHNHHGFDTRQMTQNMNSTAPPFGSHGHPPTFGMPPF